MQRIAVAIFALIAIAVAQQVGPFPVPQTVNSGQVINAVLPAGPQLGIYNAQLYQIYIPTNASSITFAINNYNYSGPCGTIQFTGRTGGLPCNYADSYYSTSEYLCSNGWTFTASSSVSTSTLMVGASDDLFDFPLGQWAYFAVGVYSGSYNDSYCGYQMNVTVNANCAAGSVAVETTSSVFGCVPLLPLVSGTQVSIANPTAQMFYAAYKISVPQSTGHIRILLNSTVTSTRVYGKNYSPSSYYASEYNCYDDSGDSVGNFYITNMICYTPRAGDFYITVSNSAVSTMTMTATVVTCGAGLGGFNCTAPSVPLNTTTALTTGAALTVSGTNGVGGYGFSYLYFDVPANYTQDDITISAATSGSGSTYIYIRRDGFPESTSTYGYEDSNEYRSLPSFFTVNQFEWAVAGRIYIGLQCYTTAGCPITVSGNKTAPVTSGVSSGVSSGNTGISTGSNSGTGISTGGITTQTASSSNTIVVTTAEAESSSVAALVPALFFAVVALLF